MTLESVGEGTTGTSRGANPFDAINDLTERLGKDGSLLPDGDLSAADQTTAFQSANSTPAEADG